MSRMRQGSRNLPIGHHPADVQHPAFSVIVGKQAK
jgi:hypothetical protein